MLRFAFALALTVAFATPAMAHHPYDLQVANNPKMPLRVIDGDTIQYGKRKVRALGYDTPEKGGLAKCDAERDLSARATARLIQLITPPHVFTMKWGKGSDKFGRGLARFYSDHKEIGAILIAEGLARPYDGVSPRGPWCR